jgi:hypothetical protein
MLYASAVTEIDYIPAGNFLGHNGRRIGRRLRDAGVAFLIPQST